MARAKKITPTLDALLFAQPQQRLLRFLLTEPTTPFNLRVLSSKVKNIRGIGGAEGQLKVLLEFEELGLVEFLDNRKAVRLVNEHYLVPTLKMLASVMDIEGLRTLLEPLCRRGILFGSRGTGKNRSDSDFDLFVSSEQKDEVIRITEGFPLGKDIEVVVWPEADYEDMDRKDPGLAKKLSKGIQLWGPSW
jgi:hypothetical protein